MPEEWTGQLLGRMHNARVTRKEIADEMGVARPYISMILSGKRNPRRGRERMEAAMEAILKRREERKELT